MGQDHFIEFIESPTICSPYSEPTLHHALDRRNKPTNRILRGRHKSAYATPTRTETKNSAQAVLPTEQEHYEVTRARKIVREWRKNGYPHVTKTTSRLLEFWQNAKRNHPLFFCQIEAVETAIYLNEVDEKIEGSRTSRLLPTLHGFSNTYNESLLRIAFKMATGAGKTLVMAMLIAYHYLNRDAQPNDKRFAKNFLIVSPGLTIKDRLQVLRPREQRNYYREHDLVPSGLMHIMLDASIEIVNFHTLKRKDRGEGSVLARRVAGQGDADSFRESEAAMVERVCGKRGRDILILNDEAHHCYRRKQEAEEEEPSARGAEEEEEREETQRRNEQARIWIGGLESIARVREVRAVYDLSATPFFLRGSGEPEGKLFPWVVSDFSLTEAIESGIVKIPRIPVDDNRPQQDEGYRNLWQLIGKQLPRKGARKEKIVPSAGLLSQAPDLERALRFLYGQYEKVYTEWQGSSDVPPVFIVVCQNTNISRMVRDWIAGFRDERGFVHEGNLALFRNEENGGFLPSPRTILVDSQEMEAAEGLGERFKQKAQDQIANHSAMHAGRVTPKEILRQTMNSVGRHGELGGFVRCVVSVSMLTEGWDTTTVTHILGVRAFGTKLLCEQVVGRALRRTSYEEKIRHRVRLDSGEEEEVETFAPEYAEIYGVPFEYFPCLGQSVSSPRPYLLTHVRALRDRSMLEIRFPRVEGYSRVFPPSRLRANFTAESHLAITTESHPTELYVSSVFGSDQQQRVELSSLRDKREAEVAYKLTAGVLTRYCRGDWGRVFGGGVEGWRFENLLEIVKAWMAEYVVVGDGCFKQLLLEESYKAQAIERIGRALAPEEEETREDGEQGGIVPHLPPYDREGSTRYVKFTTKSTLVYKTERSHVSHVIADTLVWEQALARKMERMEEVLCYVKNERLGFTIPYEHGGKEREYYPDFIAYIDDGAGLADPLRLILEVKGREREESRAKADTTRRLWLPAVNGLGEFGRWDFLELRNVNTMQNEIRELLQKRKEKDNA